MTDRTCELIYDGPVRAGSVSVPGRRARFERGVPVAFTEAEAATLDGTVWKWAGERTHPGTGVAGDGTAVPVGSSATLLADDGPDGGLVLVDGQKFGSPAEVLAAATSPARARALLDHERTLARPRKTVVAQLEQLVDGDPAGAAGANEEA